MDAVAVAVMEPGFSNDKNANDKQKSVVYGVGWQAARADKQKSVYGAGRATARTTRAEDDDGDDAGDTGEGDVETGTLRRQKQEKQFQVQAGA